MILNRMSVKMHTGEKSKFDYTVYFFLLYTSSTHKINPFLSHKNMAFYNKF